ncbi:ribbon-helix-helix protein, CopG family [Methylomagnum ishizawai]|uniref:ribbon-helix-helix protein, CopG family n=1 Tax=Methylomagnum ishizawai TaxID=1760988 RepID=UPI001C3394A7|nr:ribbon-helix-helix protein, CopG family [Methylomagnum ishizawai]BBL77484.1 hypothetical protein MishRS11D_45820 [Methylomagnum ishizawai]
MSRVSKNLGFTVPPAMAEEFEQLAKAEQSTKSELFRRMVRLYKTYRNPIGQRTDNAEGWVERLILEAQEEERRNPMTAEEFAAETERLMDYGAERSRALGIRSEEELNEMLYAERETSRQATRRS